MADGRSLHPPDREPDAAGSEPDGVDADGADGADAPPAGPALPPAKLLGRNDYTRLLTAQAVSGLGDWMATTAFMALVLDLTGSPTAVGGVLVVRLLPGVMAGPIAARVTSRWPARRTMLSMDVVRAGTVALIPFVEQVWWIYALAAALEVSGLVFLPARDSSVPRLVDRDHLPTANALILGSSYATLPLGAAAFPAVAGFGGDWIPLRDSYSLVFWVDAATFAVSFALVAGIRRLPTAELVVDEAGPTRLRDALGIDLVRQVLPAAVGASIGLGALFSVGIVFVQDVLGASSAAFGLLIVAFGTGAVAGVGLVQRHAEPPGITWARDGIRIAGASVLAISTLPGIGPAYLAALVLGGSVAYGLVAGISFLQTAVEERELALAFTAFYVAIRLSLGVAALATGVAADLVPDVDLPVVGEVESPRIVLAAAGILVLATTASVASDRAARPLPEC